MGFERFRYDGRKVLVVGGATGMGAAAAQTTAEAGASVVVMDVVDVDYPVTQFVKVDLRDEGAVDAACAEVDGPLHALFSCAGVADGTPGIEAINFIAHRHVIEKLVAEQKLAAGSAVALISSTAGIGWPNKLDLLREYLATPGWAEAQAWIDAHPGTASYVWSKQALNAYIAENAYRLLQQGVRINAILPGPTDSPLGLANADLWLGTGKEFRDSLGKGTMHAEQMGDAMVFLCSDAASGITGEILTIDHGQVVAADAGTFPDAIVDYLHTA